MSPSTTRHGITVALRPIGRLEGEESSHFRRAVAALSGVDGAHVVVDLVAVPSLDDAAARALAQAGSELARRGGTLTLEHVRAQARERLAHSRGLVSLPRPCPVPVAVAAVA